MGSSDRQVCQQLEGVLGSEAWAGPTEAQSAGRRVRTASRPGADGSVCSVRRSPAGKDRTLPFGLTLMWCRTAELALLGTLLFLWAHVSFFSAVI